MKILIAASLFPPDVGGPATYTATLARKLAVRGVEITVVHFGQVRHFPRGISHFFYFIKLLIAARVADIIYSQDPVSVGRPASYAARLLGKPLVLKVVGDYAWEQGVQRYEVDDLLDEFLKREHGGKIKTLQRAQQKTAQQARRIIVPSHYLKHVISRWGISEEKIVVVPNAVEVPRDLPQRGAARTRLGLSSHEFFILSVGREVPWKGFKVLREVVEELKVKYPNMVLKILTQVPRREVLVAMCGADLFVLNTGYEGFPHSVLEAMALGTPVITTTAGGNPEVVRDGENGLLVTYDNRGELERAIVRLYRDSALREALAEKGSHAAKEFSVERMVDRTMDVFEEIYT